MPLVYIGLGTNLGDKNANIIQACSLLTSHEQINIVKSSAIEETEPVDYLDQPSFLNQIMLIETALLPAELLEYTQSIEIEMGRKKIIPKGPRIIDLDILLYGDQIIDLPELKIPHPEIKNRQFILKHLLEINPDLKDPVTGKEYKDIYEI